MDYGDQLTRGDWYIFTPPRWYIFSPPLILRGQKGVMMINGAAARTTRGFARTFKSDALRGAWPADFIRARGHWHRAPKAGHITASRIDHRLALTLASMGPSTHDNAYRIHIELFRATAEQSEFTS